MTAKIHERRMKLALNFFQTTPRLRRTWIRWFWPTTNKHIRRWKRRSSLLSSMENVKILSPERTHLAAPTPIVPLYAVLLVLWCISILDSDTSPTTQLGIFCTTWSDLALLCSTKFKQTLNRSGITLGVENFRRSHSLTGSSGICSRSARFLARRILLEVSWLGLSRRGTITSRTRWFEYFKTRVPSWRKYAAGTELETRTASRTVIGNSQ